jgi:hypothetical protein
MRPHPFIPIQPTTKICSSGWGDGGPPSNVKRESVLFIGTQFSILYTSMYSPAEAATSRA